MALEMDVVYGATGNCTAGENKAGAACVNGSAGQCLFSPTAQCSSPWAIA